MKNRYGIIISTYNRCESLKDTLHSLLSLKFDTHQIDLELIVINNNSTDNTENIVLDFAKNAPFPVRHIFEAKQGLSYARNRGIRESKSEYVLFTDDDVLVDPHWVQAVYETFVHYDADCVAGKIIPFWEKDPPAWILEPRFRKALSGVFALLDHGDESFVLKELALDFFYGANMSFRRACFDELGYLREDLGMTGKKRRYGEDTELVVRFFNAGKVMAYTPKAIVHHKVPAWRMNMNYVRKWRFEKALDALPETKGLPIWLVKECFANAIKAVKSHALGKKYDGIAYELQFCTQAGQMIGIMKAKKS
jgi:glucosyl-dolichyl phosphate glucuronosyltransferase